MNFNLILIGFDIEYIDEFSDNIFAISNFNNLISLHSIRKDINNRLYSKEYLSRAMFYEHLEQKIDYNNIIIPGNYTFETMKEIKIYTDINSKASNRTFIVGILSSSYLKYAESYARMKIVNRKSKIPDTMINYNIMESDTYKLKQKQLENLHYNNFFGCPSFIFRTDEDVYTNTINFTNFCLEKNFKILLKEQ